MSIKYGFFKKGTNAPILYIKLEIPYPYFFIAHAIMNSFIVQ